MSNTIPKPEPAHNWADLLRLVDDVRRLAFDRSLDDADRSKRIRDRLNEHRGLFNDPDEGGES